MPNQHCLQTQAQRKKQNEDLKTRDQRRNQNEAKSIHHVSKIGPNQCVRVGVYF